jgi:hypothetical protein
VTVTDPAQVLGCVNQTMGPQAAGFNFLNHIEPAPASLMMGAPGFGGNCSPETLFFDDQFDGPFWPTSPPGTGSRTAPLTAPFFLGNRYNDLGSPLPGGLRTRVTLHSFLGIAQDNHGILHPETGPYDSATITFKPLPANTPVPPVVSALAAIDFTQPGIASIGLAGRVEANGRTNMGWAPIGGVPVAVSSSNAAALPLPPTRVVPEGASVGLLQIADPQVDAPTVVNVSATLAGTTLQQTVTVNPVVPLALALAAINYVQGVVPQVQIFGLGFNRSNFAAQVIGFASSKPAVLPVPVAVNVPPRAQAADKITVTSQPVPEPTPVLVSASALGGSVSRTITIARTVDAVAVSKG